MKKTLEKTLVAGLLASTALLGATTAATGTANADTDSYMSCLDSKLPNYKGVPPRLDSSWVGLGRMVEQHLASGVSPADEVARLHSGNLAQPVAAIVVECVVDNKPL
jgi:hypothetical protein